jgi:rod shape-determining protein MreC
LALPGGISAQRLALVLMIAFAAGLLVLAKADAVLVERLRSAIVDTAMPLLDVLARPMAAVDKAIGTVRELASIRAENARLREDNARLLLWQDMARRLEKENARLRELLAAADEPARAFVSARVIGDSGGPFLRTMLLNAGAAHGIGKGQGVVTSLGLVGRIAEVGERSSRMLLLTDLNSRLPVRLEKTRHRAILAGDNSAEPKLEYLPFDAEAEPGERVLTSGDGGMVPQGLPVGIVAKVGADGVAVRLYAELERLEFVRVLRLAVAAAARPAETPIPSPGR